MRRTDVVIGVVLALGFAAVLWEATTFQYGTEFAPGPGFAPLWLAGIGIAMSLLIAAMAARAAPAHGRGAPTGGDGLQRSGLLRVAASLVGMVVMLAVVPTLGLVLAVLLYLLFLTLAVQRLSLLAGLATSCATMLFVYLVFVRFLGVPMPSGPLGF